MMTDRLPIRSSKRPTRGQMNSGNFEYKYIQLQKLITFSHFPHFLEFYMPNISISLLKKYLQPYLEHSLVRGRQESRKKRLAKRCSAFKNHRSYVLVCAPDDLVGELEERVVIVSSLAVVVWVVIDGGNTHGCP